jgi:hypothetical protein
MRLMAFARTTPEKSTFMTKVSLFRHCLYVLDTVESLTGTLTWTAFWILSELLWNRQKCCIKQEISFNTCITM